MEPFGPDWIVAENQTCQAHNPAPELIEAVTWSGGCVDGKAEGGGMLVLRRHDGRVNRYEGQLRTGKRHGRGSMSYHDGGRYEGEWRDGERHGKGVMINALGRREGEWQKGRYRAGKQWYEEQSKYRREVEAHRAVLDLWFAVPEIVRKLKQRLHSGQVRGQTPHARRIRNLQSRLPRPPRTRCGTMELRMARDEARHQDEEVVAGQVKRRPARLKFWQKLPLGIPPLPGLRRTRHLKRTRYDLWQESSYPFSRNRLGQYQYNLRQATRPGYRRPLGSDIPTIRLRGYRFSLRFAARPGYRRIDWNSYPYRDRRATPLHKAAQGESPAAVQALLAAAADLEARNHLSATPLHEAVLFGCHSIAITKALIDAGADLEAREIYGKTPLHVAAAYNDSAIMVEVLIGAGAEVDARDEYGMTPLHWAACNGKTSGIVPVFLDAGADPNARDNRGMTPLHRAVPTFGESSATVAKVIEAGADLDAQDEKGVTPFAHIRSFRKGWKPGDVPTRAAPLAARP